jgi:hypothetical protein
MLLPFGGLLTPKCIVYGPACSQCGAIVWWGSEGVVENAPSRHLTHKAAEVHEIVRRAFLLNVQGAALAEVLLWKTLVGCNPVDIGRTYGHSCI